jgi:hypothetical protein
MCIVWFVKLTPIVASCVVVYRPSRNREIMQDLPTAVSPTMMNLNVMRQESRSLSGRIASRPRKSRIVFGADVRPIKSSAFYGNIPIGRDVHKKCRTNIS